MNLKTIRRTLAGPWVPPYMGKAPYLWAAALVYPMMKYFFIPAPTLEALAMIVTLVLFVPLYFASYWLKDRQSLLAIALTCLVGLAWTPFNGGVSAFFIYAAAMSGGITRPRLAYMSVVTVIGLGALAGYLLAPKSVQFLIPTVTIGLPVGLAAVMESTLRRSRNQLLRKQEEVEHMATIAERERISRDLHDLLGHTLSLITLKAELAGKLASRDIEACKSEIADIEKSARNALAEVRAAVTGYRLTGFAHELASARAGLAAAGIALDEQVGKLALPAAAENVMALALREAVTNIIRHAGATRCEVSLAERDGAIVMRIADNGSLRTGAALRHGNGLTGMTERVAAIGGRLALDTAKGLALELRLPMGAPA